MADNLNKTGRPDDIRINIHEDYEVRYWSHQFRVPPEAIKQAVHSVGPMVQDVKRHLRLSA